HAYFASSATELRATLEAVLELTGLTAPGVGVTSRTAPVLTNGTNGFHAQFNSGYRQSSTGPWEGILERRRFECTTGLHPEEQGIKAEDRFHEVISAQSARTLYTVIPSEACSVRGHLVGTGVATLAPMAFSSSGTSTNGGGQSGRGGKNTTCGPRPGSSTDPRCPTPPVDDGVDAYADQCKTKRTSNEGEPLETNLAFTNLSVSPSSLTADHLFLSTKGQAAAAERQAIIDWVRGVTRTNDLGAIQHSTPVIVGAPEDIADESHNLFRQRGVVRHRPSVLYVGTSDGILHAISTRDQKSTVTGASYDYKAGEELWGFIPPVLLPNLQSARHGHQPMMDGTPVVRDIFTRRVPGEAPNGEIYRTILISGFRSGGAGYFALDVTDPRNPEFLWQFSHPDMGKSFGQPAIAQVAVNVSQSGGGTRLEERAIAILPGGGGDELSAELGCGKCYICGTTAQLEPPTLEQIASGECHHNEPIGCATNGLGAPRANSGTINARTHQKCWGERGRSLFFVDPATGELVGHLDDTVFGSPLVGGMAVFPGDTGTVASSAYTTDADGVIWRIDISNPDMSKWSAARLFDTYWGEGAAAGQPAFEAPIVTTDPTGNVVVIQATGNVDSYDAFTTNKVVSITETFSVSSQTTAGTGGNPGSVSVSYVSAGDGPQIGATLNWQITLRPSEQVTGPLALFNRQLFFATFTGMPDNGNACANGESR
ncbi:MAG: hypothetical protein H5U40_14890, partial [Polyangiaceae bacterium]|nr:hypothetical protein [Polyangiaceae bacterium]